MSTDFGTTSPAEITPIPPPWTAKAEAWWFVTSLGHRVAPGETLPLSYFPSQDTLFYQASMTEGSFRGGRGSITLIRYTDTPIGPFDELAISPGEFTNPFEDPAHRVTRAYVSSLPAVVNGRSNWGIPRELAQFVFTPSLEHEDATEVHVYPAISFSPVEFSPNPCFSVLIKPVPLLPSIPASLMPFRQVKLYQPPLEGSPDYLDNGLVAVPKWHALDTSRYKGQARPFRCQGLMKPQDPAPDVGEDAAPVKRIVHKTGIADGIAFPDVEPYSIGIHWTEVEMTLPQAIPLATL